MKKILGGILLGALASYAIMGMALSADTWSVFDKALAIALIVSAVGLAGMRVVK